MTQKSNFTWHATKKEKFQAHQWAPTRVCEKGPDTIPAKNLKSWQEKLEHCWEQKEECDEKEEKALQLFNNVLYV